MNRYVPKRRFKGFIETWEEKKLGEVTHKIDYGLNAPAGRYDGKNKYIRITDIDETTRIFLNTDLTSPECNLEIADNYLLKNKDILFARTGASVGKSYIYRKSDGKVYFAGFLIRFRIDNNHSDEFIYQYTFTKHYKKFVLITSQRSGQPGINSQEYAEMKILFPSLTEQKRIGSFFKNLDKQIDKQGKKVEKLKNLKQAYSSEMFPAEGELFPKRRFKGFTEPWEESKFDKIFNVSQGLQIPINKRFLEPGDDRYFYITNEFLKENNDEKFFIENPSKNVLCNIDDILITRTGNTGIIVSDVEGCFHNNFFKLDYDKNKYDKKFLVNYLSSDLIQRIIIKNSGGSTIPDLSHKSFYSILGKFPTIEEQKLIGAFLEKLDNEIYLEQKKLEKLKQLKQAYLEEMFV